MTRACAALGSVVLSLTLSFALRTCCAAEQVAAAKVLPPLIPGTGEKVALVGDDFENPNWRYVPNGEKASYEQDDQQRPPGGKAVNGRWYESAKRGQPDVIQRLATPPGGLPGSTGSLFLCTKFSGVPGELAGEQMQDDLLMGVAHRLGRPIGVNWQPSFVVRVFLPDFQRWENRSGTSLGIRADVRGRNPDGEVEPYWPGTFLLFRSETSKKYDRDFAQLSVRANLDGADVPGPKIAQSGWWTFGMSFTPDGRVHHYARAGVGPLRDEDRLYSSKPYGMTCLAIDNFFVDVANFEDGKSWSTPWVIDDPTVYVVPPHGLTVADLQRGKSPAGSVRQLLEQEQFGVGAKAPTAPRQAALDRFLKSVQRR